MLSCGHDPSPPYGAPSCVHVRSAAKTILKYVCFYTGEGMNHHDLCEQCSPRAESGTVVPVGRVCEPCHDELLLDCVGWAGRAQILDDPQPVNTTLLMTPLPAQSIPARAIAPLDTPGARQWLILSDPGRLYRWDCDTGACELVGATALTTNGQSPHTYLGHHAALRIHASPSGRFAAIAVDYGVDGVVLDLSTGREVLRLHGGTHHQETVPFSLAFTTHRGREILIHRTAWNRLDAVDLATRKTMTKRKFPTPKRQGRGRPPHYRDYFHGALYLNPSGTRIADDGWIWSPVGAVTAWSMEPWLTTNPFESEDGASRVSLCARDYYWDHAMVWLDDDRLAVGGIGDDDLWIIPGARIFDLRRGTRSPNGWLNGAEHFAFAGPGTRFFAAHGLLYAAGDAGLEIWDPDTGARLGSVRGFHPTHHHRAADELAVHTDTCLLRWPIEDPRE